MASPLDPHHVWAIGHALVLAGSAHVLLRTAFFQSTPAWSYRLAYVGALLSYSIVIYKSLGRPNGTAWIRRAFVDENAQYGLLALYWFISKPINISILPFATFSLFHCATFFRTNILPKFIPRQQASPSGTNGAPAPSPSGWADSLNRRIQLWVKNNYDKAMNFVAWAELIILARLALGALTSMIAPLFLAHFVRLRYHASPFTRSAVINLVARIDGLVVGKPQPIVNAWATIKRAVGSWGGGSLVPGPTGQPGAPAAAGPGAGPGAARR